MAFLQLQTMLQTTAVRLWAKIVQKEKTAPFLKMSKTNLIVLCDDLSS